MIYKYKKPRYKLGEVVYYINYDESMDNILKPEIDMSVINCIHFNKKYTWYSFTNGKNIDDYLCFKTFLKAYKYLLKLQDLEQAKESLK